MKNKLVFSMLIAGTILLTGCANQQVLTFKDQDTESKAQDTHLINADQATRFKPNGDRYCIGNRIYKVYFDTENNIVYLADDYGSGNYSLSSLCPLIGKDRLPSTIEEYNKTRDTNTAVTTK